MKLIYAALLVTTALGAGSAVLALGQNLPLAPGASLTSRAAPGSALILIDGDEDEGDGEGAWFWSLSDDDDDDCEDDDDDDDDEEGADFCTQGAAGDAAKAGTVAPPKNGLFTDGTAPVVKTN